MSVHQFKTTQFLNIGIIEAWDFFSTPLNLPEITPPYLDFKILTKLSTDKIYEGMIIDYVVKPILNISMHWQTRIYNVIETLSFTDKQMKGPYKMWEHTHFFEEKNDGVLMTDIILYELPFGILGDIAHSLFIRKKIENIFAYRQNILSKKFNPYENCNS